MTNTKQKISDIRGNLEMDPLNRQNMATLKTLITRFESLENTEREGKRIRAKEQNIKDDERSTRYFFKKKKTAKIIGFLLNETNIPLESKDDNIKEVENYYQKFYETEGINQNQINENLSHIKASEHLKKVTA